MYLFYNHNLNLETSSSQQKNLYSKLRSGSIKGTNRTQGRNYNQQPTYQQAILPDTQQPAFLVSSTDEDFQDDAVNISLISQNIEYNDEDKLDDYELNSRIQKSVERYLSKKLQDTQHSISSQAKHTQQMQHNLNFSYDHQQQLNSTVSHSIDPQKQVFSQMIDSFTGKIQELQQVISQQNFIIEQKAQEIYALKQYIQDVKVEKQVPQNLQTSTFDNKLQKTEREVLRKFIAPTQDSVSINQLKENYESQIKVLQREITQLNQEIVTLQPSPKPLSQSTDVSVQCRLTSDQTLLEMNHSLQLELDKERKSSSLLKQRLSKMEMEYLNSNEKRNHELYQAIQALKGELEVEKKIQEIETLKGQLVEMHESNEKLCLEIEELKSQGKQKDSLSERKVKEMEKEINRLKLKPEQSEKGVGCQIIKAEKYEEIREEKKMLQDNKESLENEFKACLRQLEDCEKERDLLKSKDQVALRDSVQMAKELNQKTMEVEGLIQKYDALDQALKAKDSHLLTLKEEIQTKDNLFKLQLETERTQSKLQLDQQKMHYTYLIESQSKDFDKQLTDIKKPDTSNQSITCDLLTVREVATLKARLDTLQKDFSDQRFQIEVLEAQVDRKDEELLQRNRRLRDLEELNTLNEVQLRDQDNLRRLIGELQSINAHQHLELRDYKSRIDAREYVTSMMHRQQEHQIEKRINSEVQLVRSQFERDRQIMIQNFQAKLDQMTTNMIKSVDEVEVQTVTREMHKEDCVVSCSIISNSYQENIKELQGQLKVKDQEMSNIKGQVHMIQEQIKDQKQKMQEKEYIIQSLKNYIDAKQYTEELFRYLIQLNKPRSVVNCSQTQTVIQSDAEISCNFENIQYTDEIDLLKTQITELQETVTTQSLHLKEQTINYNCEVGKSQAQMNQMNELNAELEGQIIRLLTQIDARDYTRELLKQAQLDKVFYSQHCQTVEPTKNDQDILCDLTQLEQQILLDQNLELQNQVELLQYSNNELTMTNQNLQEQLYLVIPKQSFDQQIETEEQSSELQNLIIEEEIVGESIVSQWEQYSSELQSQLTNIQQEYNVLEQRLNEKEVLIQNQQTQISDFSSQLTSQTVRELIENESQCELLTSDQLYESSLKCQELSTHQQYLLDENTRIVSDYDYLLNQKNDDISYLQQQLLDKDQQLLALQAIEKYDQETQCELVTQESINELQRLICHQQEIIDSLKSQEKERIDFEIQVTDESSLLLIEDLQSEINRQKTTIEQLQQQAAEDQTVVKSLEDQLLTCQQQLSQMQEDKQMAIASKDQELLALQKQLEEVQEILSSKQIKQTQEQQEVQCNIITLHDIEEKDEQLSTLKEANEEIKSQNQHLDEELKEVNLHLQNQKAQFEEIQEEMQTQIDQLTVELKDTQNKFSEEVQKNTKNLTIDNEIQCQLLSISDLELLQLNLDTLQREHQVLNANYQEELQLMEQLRLESSQQLQIIENVKRELNQKDELIYDISCEKMELEKKLLRPVTSDIEVECNIITSEDLLALTYQVKQAQSQVLECQQTSSQLQNDVDSHKEENLLLTSQLNDAQLAINKYQTEHQDCQKCHEREAESSSLRAHIDQLTAEYHKLEESIKGLPEELKQRHEMIEALNNKVKELMVANSGNIDNSKNIEALSQALIKMEEDNKQKDTIINQLKEQMIKIFQQEQQHGPPISPKMTIVEKSQLAKPDEGTYVFCYGSNHPQSMAKNLGLTIQEFLSRCISCGLPGYGRVFVGTSFNWGNCSFANIIPHAKSEVEGYAVKLSEEELMKLDQSVGYPKIYNRIKVSLKKLPYTEGEILKEGAAYILIEKQLLSKYKRPTAEYLDATCKTLSASLFLRIGAYEDNKHELKLKVFKQTDITLDLLHETFASIKFLLS